MPVDACLLVPFGLRERARKGGGAVWEKWSIKTVRKMKMVDEVEFTVPQRNRYHSGKMLTPVCFSFC